MSLKTFPAVVRAPGAVAVLVVSVAGCDFSGLLDVSDPSRLLAENVEVPAQAAALMNGLEADFICAHGAFVVVTADLSDEFEDTNAGGDNWSLDRRRPQSQDNWGDNDCTAALPSSYLPASRSRWVADNATRLLEGWTDAEVANRSERLARATLLAGFSANMLGASMCTAALDEGPELTSMQLFAEAEARFTKVLGVAGVSSNIANAARVGRARVRLYLGNEQGALSDAQAVPEGFVMNISPAATPARLYNRVWAANQFGFNFGVPEWSRNLTTGGVPDPRTAVSNTGRNTGWAPGPVWAQQKYSKADSPMPIARGAEAQLIMAEIQGGQEAVAIINKLRAPHGLPSFSSTNETEIQNMVAAERQRELWFEGFRAYDIRRLNLPLFPAPNEGYQVGVKGGSYGDQTCIPIPNIELFNNKTLRG